MDVVGVLDVSQNGHRAQRGEDAKQLRLCMAFLVENGKSLKSTCQELIDELGALHKDLKEAVRRQELRALSRCADLAVLQSQAYERDLQKVLKTTKPRPPQEQVQLCLQ